jgi:hypothetical protein
MVDPGGCGRGRCGGVRRGSHDLPFGEQLTGRGPTAAPDGVPTTFLNLSIALDPTTGNFVYTTPDVSVVAHAEVRVTILNHDTTSGTPLHAWDHQVLGTIGGTELVSTGYGPHAEASFPSDGISHTSTISDAFYNISVPIPPAPSSSVPSVVTFELMLNTTEAARWARMWDCQNGAMTPGVYGSVVIKG